MSAFTLRKRLLESQNESSSSGTSPSPAVSVTGDIGVGASAKSPRKSGSRQKRARKDGQQSRTQDAAHQLVPPPGSTISVMTQAQSLGQADVDGTSTPPLETVPAFTEPREPAAIFSTYTPNKASYRWHKDGTVVVNLTEGERIVLLGSYGLRLRSGKITINGAVLGPRSTVAWVDAPQCYALPVIRSVEDSVVELHSHQANKDLRQLATVSPMFRGLWLDDPGSTFKIVGEILQALINSSADRDLIQIPTSLDGPKRTVLQDLVSPPEWNREIARVSRTLSNGPSTIMVTGPKSSGKSTFGKMLANRMISESAPKTPGGKVGVGLAILDLDPGQPEYGVPGQVSLVHVLEPILGPAFTRPIPVQDIRTIRAHNLASISPASDPELYLEAAKDLYTHYRNTLGSASLIVNMPGWIQGTGLDLLVSLIGDLRPSEVIYMSQTGPSDTVEGLSVASRSTTFTMLPSNTTTIAARSAAQLRAMQLTSYFHVEPHAGDAKPGNTLKSDPMGTPYSWINTPLTHVPPWEVEYSSHSSGIAGIICYDYQAPPALLADTINGTIVAVVEVEDVRAFRGITVTTTTDDDPEPRSSSAEEGQAADHSVPPPTGEMDIDTTTTASAPASASASTASALRDLTAALQTRTPEGLPLLDTRGTTLDPQYSRSLGLALVRGVDAANQRLQLITPIPGREFARVSADEDGEDRQIVLVAGKFDTPSWAYTEDFYYADARRSGGGGGGGEAPANIEDGEHIAVDGEYNEDDNDDNMGEGDGEFDISVETEELVQPEYITAAANTIKPTDTPWIEELRGSQKRGIASKVWRVRRDLGKSNNAGD